ncbi:alginate export family protein [Azospirillum sp.]|uniref:alginate export family protein n=1 Tax=Azospirillum sp. TaxID=34012 RepID=UPI002D3C3A07|nr:alginate export family protein [Azospirillum sp.]HYD64059.1 alginate export family protein [Azospirillum sp.]
MGNVKHARAALGAALLAGALSGPALADVTVYEKDGIKFDVGATAGAGLFHVGNTYFGTGVTRPNGNVDRSPTWGEGFVAPSAALTIDTGAAGTLYGGVRVVGAATIGDGDAGGFVQREEGKFNLDHAYVGWRSGKLFGGLGEDVLDLSFGRQPYVIGDGFLIADGNFEFGREGAYWLAPRNGWQPAAIARIKVDPVQLDLFRLKSDRDSGSDVIYGVNLDWKSGAEGKNVVGGSFLRIDESNIPTRDGLRVFSVRAQGNFIPAVSDLFLAGEFVTQHNDRAGAEVNARAWYGEAAYRLSSVTWTPKVGYRYSHFSGDKPGTAKSEAYDPLHYGMARGWGTWFQGELTGQYYLSNSNLNVHTLSAAVQPTEKLTLSALYYVFNFDRTPAGLTSKHFGNELNLIADYAATENLTLSGVFGWLRPGEGGKQLFGRDKDTTLFEVIALAKF